MIVTIDGPAGAGKSTVARRVAGQLGFAYLDTGALYRAAALNARRSGIALEEGAQLLRMMERIEIRFENGRTLLANQDVSDAIRTSEISQAASEISAIASVRERLLPLQRRVGHAAHTVAEGRDMGTVVFSGRHPRGAGAPSASGVGEPGGGRPAFRSGEGNGGTG